MKLPILAAALCLAATPMMAHPAMAQHHHDHTTNSQSPWQFDYHFDYMRMSGLRDGTHNVSRASVYAQGFMHAPDEMTTSAHVFSLGYRFSDRFSVTGSTSYQNKTMKMISDMGAHNTMKSDGIGDTLLMADYGLWRRGMAKVIFHGGLSLPTGAIDKEDRMGGMMMRLGYGMQMGSGTWDPTLGISYQSRMGDWSWGAKANSLWRLHDNTNDYRLGNVYEAALWTGYQFNSALSGTLGLHGTSTGNVRGSDAAMDATMSPSSRADMRGGQALGLMAGLMLDGGAALPGASLMLHGGVPFYQSLEGPQLEHDYHLKIGGHLRF